MYSDPILRPSCEYNCSTTSCVPTHTVLVKTDMKYLPSQNRFLLLMPKANYLWSIHPVKNIVYKNQSESFSPVMFFTVIFIHIRKCVHTYLLEWLQLKGGHKTGLDQLGSK